MFLVTKNTEAENYLTLRKNSHRINEDLITAKAVKRIVHEE